MITILSCDNDPSTDQVIDWIKFYGQDFSRINGDKLVDNEIVVNLDSGSFSSHLSLHKSKEEREELLDSKYCQVVWYRRWGTPRLFARDHRTASIGYQILQCLLAQFKVLSRVIWDSLSHCTWLNHPSNLKLNKLLVLNHASNVGLSVPSTIICNRKKDLLSFKEKHKRIIVKGLDETDIFFSDRGAYSIYTSEIDKESIDQIENFFPSLAQELIEKEYELRIFYLEGTFYSMAIFSQNNDKTKVDFRRYDLDKPNRSVPYQLPLHIEQKIDNLMKALDINSGSIDMIKQANGGYIFLEVNPIGQFSMVSVPCNYYLEEKICTTLLTFYEKNTEKR